MRALNEKKYQFTTLCSSLTKQGFQFNVDKKNAFKLIFKDIDLKRIYKPGIKLPFVDSIQYNNIDGLVYFNQWADKYLIKI